MHGGKFKKRAGSFDRLGCLGTTSTLRLSWCCVASAACILISRDCRRPAHTYNPREALLGCPMWPKEVRYRAALVNLSVCVRHWAAHADGESTQWVVMDSEAGRASDTRQIGGRCTDPDDRVAAGFGRVASVVKSDRGRGQVAGYKEHLVRLDNTSDVSSENIDASSPPRVSCATRAQTTAPLAEKDPMVVFARRVCSRGCQHAAVIDGIRRL